MQLGTITVPFYFLVTAKFPFAPFNGQDPRMEFERRKKGKYERAEKFVEKMKEIQEEAKVALGKIQEDMKKYADRRRSEVDKYKVGDLVMLSTKDLKYQMVRRRTEKLTERFVGLYKVQKIVSSNAVKLKVPNVKPEIYSGLKLTKFCKFTSQEVGLR